MRLHCIVFLINLLFSSGCCLNILGIFPNSGYSQYILGSTLMKELANRGHEVTVIAPFKQTIPVMNYNEIYVDGLGDNNRYANILKLEGTNSFQKGIGLYRFGLFITEYTLNHTSVRKFLKANLKFDLVICEQFVNEAHFAFARHFKAPLILFSSLGPTEWINEKAGNPSPISYVPNIHTHYNSHMTFMERFHNSVLQTFHMLYKYFVVFPRQNEIAQKYFEGVPDLREIIYNASLILLNSHVSVNEPVPLMHSMVEIGGFHIKPKTLPKDLQMFLDNATGGVVYFSIGTNVNSKHFPEKTRQVFVDTFSKLKQKVLWKWEDDKLPDQPSNVMIRKWLPQQEILNHPNVKVFISHGGLLSVTEATHFGVPLLGIPIFGDQKMNMARIAAKGFAINLSLRDIDEAKLTDALHQLLYNQSYQQAAKRFSAILRDQQVSPMGKAIYWIEYVHRHNGARHLQSAALYLSWYQYFALDVILVVALFVLLFLYFLYVGTKTVCRMFSCKTQGDVKIKSH